jgi:hypothetical protein
MAYPTRSLTNIITGTVFVGQVTKSTVYGQQ